MRVQTKIHTDLNSRSFSTLPSFATSATRWSICTCYTLYILNIYNVYVDIIVYTIYQCIFLQYEYITVYTMYIHGIYNEYSLNM